MTDSVALHHNICIYDTYERAWQCSNIKIVIKVRLTGGNRRPPIVALNKSPACVLSGNESMRVVSSPVLLIDFLCPSFISLNVTLLCDNLEREAGDSPAELSLSDLGDDPAGFSGFCKGNFKKFYQVNCN